ncbi:MAG: S9 family peptidase [Dokdonella sp.]|nr:MAG: S9 family peptidase [Dokdonella sp.]
MPARRRQRRLLTARNGANPMAEPGDPRTEPGLRQLLALDPYQRARDGAPCPPLLLVIGVNDQRVAPWNRGKFGARVQQASPATPVWYRSDADRGHFATGGDASARQWADIYAILRSHAPARLTPRGAAITASSARAGGRAARHAPRRTWRAWGT